MRQVQVNIPLDFKLIKKWSALHPGGFPRVKVPLTSIAREGVLIKEPV
jgi:hypothetical protein